VSSAAIGAGVTRCRLHRPDGRRQAPL